MRQIVECIPNFSEGRREAVIDDIVAAMQACGVQLLDVQADPDQNRSVVTVVGDIDAIERAAFAGAARAAALIDMTQHTGEYPRIGAADVIPLVPVADTSIADCIALARRLGERIGRELAIPVYLYGEAASRPERTDLAVIRLGEYEALRDTIATDPAREPDFGPSEVGAAGASAIGARYPLVTYRVHLACDRIDVANAVARGVRGTAGGLAHVEARGSVAAEGQSVVIATSVQRHDLTPLPRVLELVRREAARYGVPVRGGEIVGLLPLSALLDAAIWSLQLDDFDREQILEHRLLSPDRVAQPTSPLPQEFVAAVASESPTPGGGSVAALVGALAAALNAMVASLTIGRDKYATVQGDMRRVRVEATELQRHLLELVDADSQAFQAVMAAYRLPSGTPEETDQRREATQAALRKATEVPLATMRDALAVLQLAQTAADLGNPTAISDAGVAANMAFAAVRSASLNVEINVRGLRDLEEGDRYRQTSLGLLRDAESLLREVERLVRARIAS
jgi:glutamate formiminotransferase / formiminotetrahydrofolate cyclodeaminase